MKKQKILVTGSGGQLGQELKKLAVSYSQFEFIFLSSADLPVHHVEKVKNSFGSYHPQYCINCAAYTAVDKAESEQDLAFRVNGEATGILASVCKEYNCRFIHISTDYVFDGTASVPYKESDLTNPCSVYGASKLEGEEKALRFNPESIIIRTSWLYSEYGKNFVKTMVKLMRERSEINVVNDQYGSPTYAADLAEAIIAIIDYCRSSDEKWKPGIYHFSNEGVISWFGFASTIKELTKTNCKINPIPTSQYPTPAKRPAYSVLDKTKIRETFGIRLRDWKESLSDCIKKIN
ncbi:MAG: dTDP-4-dehydrorhamnose reductase [Chitinophagaceae bacterium]|nr:dTDP-4-dehydrorhamnose reductase [Chitinophagaceae bacterium]